MGIGVQDSLARMLAGGQGRGLRVKTARVEVLDGVAASCVMAGDEAARTTVHLAGHGASVGDVLACVGGAGSWWCAGNVSAGPPADVPVELELAGNPDEAWSWVKMRSGLAACWRGIKKPATPFTSAYGNAWFFSDEVAFPFAFAGRPHLQGSVVTGSGGLMGLSFHGTSSASRAGFYVYSLKQEASIDVYVQILAVGRWK